MAAPMRQLVSRRALSKYASLLQVRLMTGFQNRGNVPFFLDKCLQGQLVRNSSTMQSMRIPSQKVYRPDPSMSHDSFTVEMYKLKKNLQLRRYIPVAAFRRTCGLVNSRGTPISSIQGSELLSMTGEVLNVRNHRRKKLTMYVWNLLNSCEGYHLDLSNYTNYLMACKENKLSVDVTSLQEEMKQKGIQPDQEFYEELIGYHSAHGHYNSVRSLLENLKSDNFSLTANVFSNYIWAAFNAGFEGEMMTIFDSMSSHGITPDLNCYMTLMKCYAVKGDLPKITELIRQAEAVAGMRQVHQLQILLPLLQNGHRSEVNQVFDGLCVANTATKMDKMEIEYHGNQLNVNLFIQDGFNVYNLSDNTAVFFIRSYARGPGIDGRTINRPGTRKIDQTAAQRTVQMLNENKVSLQRMLLEARTISKEYITCVIWELKEQGVVESYDRFCSVLNSRPCSDYFNEESKEMLQRIAKDCFNSDTQPIGSSMPSIHTVQGHPQATYHRALECLGANNIRCTMSHRKTKKYCCSCSNFRGKEVDSKTISLHRFPADIKIRKVWIQRCKLSMKSFKFTVNSKLCSSHFVGQRGPTPIHPLPSIFGSKIYQTSSLEKSCDQKMATTSTCKMDVLCSDEESEISSNTSIATSDSATGTSVLLHDYCGLTNINSIANIRNQCSQTAPSAVSVSTQTDATLIKQHCSQGAQTADVQTREIGIQVNLPQLTFDDIHSDDKKCTFYTGMPDTSTFRALFDELSEDAAQGTGSNSDFTVGGRPRSLRLIDEFFMVLMRLRLGLILEDLAFRFCISSSTCGEIFNKWIDYLEPKLSFLLMWPSREVVNEHMPSLFRDKFPTTRIVIDCTEIKTETPNSLKLKSVMYSDYKSHSTWKSLVGISPAGTVTFVSDLWAGSISDKKIVEKSGLLNLIEPGDAIMADKGFTISDLTTPRGIHLIIPPFKRKSTFSKREVHNTKDIAQARIHVEREMERIKNFRIFEGVLPISMSARASKIWKICVYLTNLHPPLKPLP